MRAADTPERISSFLMDTLVSTNSLNNFLESAIPEISAVFGASRGILLDYRENTARFDLLHFAGFSEQARFELQHRLKEMDLTKAVEQRQPYLGESNPAMLFLPLYFTETLEAVIVLESDGLIEQARKEFDDERRKQIYWRWQELIHEEQPYTFLYYQEEVAAYSKRFQNVTWWPLRPGYDLTSWFVPKGLQKYGTTPAP